MKGYREKFNKYEKIVARIEQLTEGELKNPQDEKLKKVLKKAEDGLCNLIKREEKQIEKLLESLNDQHEWED
jgi:hypothetical protein